MADSTSQVVNIGHNVDFICITSGIVSWEFEGAQELPSNVITGYISGRRLHWLLIIKAQVDNAGTYSCTGEKDMLIFISEGKLVVQLFL